MSRKSHKPNIVVGNFSTTLDIPVDRVLDGAKGWQTVIVIGTDENGEAQYASSIGDGYQMLWMVEQFKRQLLNDNDEV